MLTAFSQCLVSGLLLVKTDPPVLLSYAAYRNLDPEEPVQSAARLCCFNNLEVTVSSPPLLFPFQIAFGSFS